MQAAGRRLAQVGFSRKTVARRKNWRAKNGGEGLNDGGWLESTPGSIGAIRYFQICCHRLRSARPTARLPDEPQRIVPVERNVVRFGVSA
jgi:hypothetical protein